MTSCYLLLLTAQGQTRDFSLINVDAGGVPRVLRSLTQSGEQVLAGWLTGERGTYPLDIELPDDALSPDTFPAVAPFSSRLN